MSNRGTLLTLQKSYSRNVPQISRGGGSQLHPKSRLHSSRPSQGQTAADFLQPWHHKRRPPSLIQSSSILFKDIEQFKSRVGIYFLALFSLGNEPCRDRLRTLAETWSDNQSASRSQFILVFSGDIVVLSWNIAANILSRAQCHTCIAHALLGKAIHQPTLASFTLACIGSSRSWKVEKLPESPSAIDRKNSSSKFDWIFESFGIVGNFSEIGGQRRRILRGIDRRYH